MKHDDALESLAGLQSQLTEMESELFQIVLNQVGPIAEYAALAFLCTSKLHRLLSNLSVAMEYDLERLKTVSSLGLHIPKQ